MDATEDDLIPGARRASLGTSTSFRSLNSRARQGDLCPCRTGGYRLGDRYLVIGRAVVEPWCERLNAQRAEWPSNESSGAASLLSTIVAGIGITVGDRWSWLVAMRQTRHLEAVMGPGSEASCQGHELSLTTTCPYGQLPPSQWGQSPPDPMRQQNKWVAPMDPEVADLTAWVLIDLASGLTTTGSVTSARTACGEPGSNRSLTIQCGSLTSHAESRQQVGRCPGQMGV